jgi:hypothetical protein
MLKKMWKYIIKEKADSYLSVRFTQLVLGAAVDLLHQFEVYFNQH